MSTPVSLANGKQRVPSPPSRAHLQSTATASRTEVSNRLPDMSHGEGGFSGNDRKNGSHADRPPKERSKARASPTSCT